MFEPAIRHGELKLQEINLSKHKNWISLVITGVISAPIIPLGAGPDMYILRESHLVDAKLPGIKEALKGSFEDFGFEASERITLNDPKLLLVPVTEISEEAIRNALIIADMALAFFNRKYFSAKARFLNWDRKEGRAIGITYANGVISPIKSNFSHSGPAIVQAVEYDFWDWFLAASLRNELSELGEALYKCIEWERESQFSSHITHKFAFNWVGLEAMMPQGECQESALVRRYSLVVGAPRGADSKIIMGDAAKKIFFEKYKNKNSKPWVKAIQEMYRYRCSILHDGSSDLSSDEIEPNKVDWFYHLTKALNFRVAGLAVNALIDKVETIEDFWESYVIDYLYSDKNHWATNGTFHQDHIIEFDWKNGTYPDHI